MADVSTLELLGDLREAEREVRAYGDAIRRFDATHPDPHVDFPDKWVGGLQGRGRDGRHTRRFVRRT